MDYITVNEAFTAVVRIPESQSTDTVTYSIIAASDGSEFASGNMTHLSGTLWKVTFTPTTADESYALVVTNSTLDIVTTNVYRATTKEPVTVETSSATTDSELLTKVKSAISSRLNGGAVDSYQMPDGRNIKYIPIPDLMALREDLEKRIAATKSYSRRSTYVNFKSVT